MSIQTQLRFWAFGVLIFFLLVFLLRDIMLPFVAGMALAYLLDPVADRLEQWGLSRVAATSLIMIGFFLFFLLSLSLALPLLKLQAENLVESLPMIFARLETVIPAELGQLLGGFLGSTDDSGNIDAKAAAVDMAKGAFNWILKFLDSAIKGGVAFFNLISLLLITPIVAFYLLLDWDKMIEKLNGWLPKEHASQIRLIAKQIDQTLAGFVRGQFSVCLILAAFYSILLMLVGLDFGLIVGVVAGLVSFIPFVGALTGLILSGFLAVVQFWPDYLHIGLVFAIFAAGQGLEGNFLTPRLVGRSVALHPVWIMFALLAFASLFGFVGMLLAVPLAATLGVLVRFGIDRYLDSPIYTGPKLDDE